MAANVIISRKPYECLALTAIASIANYLAANDIDGWRNYWSGVAMAAIGASYMFQALLALSRLIAKRHAQIEVDDG